MKEIIYLIIIYNFNNLFKDKYLNIFKQIHITIYNMSFYCYMLYTEKNHTYIGATTEPDRRLRQHNKEMSGGARATSIRVVQGLTWKRGCYISNIPEWRTALQIEWRWKQLSRTEFKHIKNPIERRLYSLKKLLNLEKPTEKSIPYEAYPDGIPIIIWDSDEIKNIYDKIMI
jgi:predicted GIY-YIG superfamily endonuclease